MTGIKNSVYTVAQANSYIKNMFTQDFLLNHISVRGEVSNCKYHSSGHIYFSIKDKSGVLSCVMFAGRRKGLNFQMSEGQKVIVTGAINVYERDGKYQLYADFIEEDGTGDLYKRFLQLKQELEEMGMFDAQYKKKIPVYAMSIGIVTAATGAAIQDIINISRRRNPYVRLVLFPAKVQGEGAADTIIEGIRRLDAMGLDVLIVGRGGGSIEDLWAFNEESVARAIFECQTPVISAVGHETDVTIADYVADLRAPTPSAAAELAVFEYAVIEEYLASMEDQFYRRLHQKLRFTKTKLEQMQWKLNKLSPHNILKEKRRYVADMQTQFKSRMDDKLWKSKHRLALYLTKLEAGSPLKKLSAGYAYAQIADQPIKSIQQVKVGDVIDVTFVDGKVKAEIKEKKYGTDKDSGNDDERTGRDS